MLVTVGRINTRHFYNFYTVYCSRLRQYDNSPPPVLVIWERLQGPDVEAFSTDQR